MYGESIDDATIDQYVALCEARHQYNIPELYEQCERILSDAVAFDNCHTLADLATRMESHEIKQVSISLSCAHAQCSDNCC